MSSVGNTVVIVYFRDMTDAVLVERTVTAGAGSMCISCPVWTRVYARRPWRYCHGIRSMGYRFITRFCVPPRLCSPPTTLSLNHVCRSEQSSLQRRLRARLGPSRMPPLSHVLLRSLNVSMSASTPTRRRLSPRTCSSSSISTRTRACRPRHRLRI